MAVYNTYSVEQEEFLKVNAPLMSRKELTLRFNAKFGTDKSVRAIKSYCVARHYNASSDGRFRDGNVSWQTGLCKEDFKSHYTEESFGRMTKKILDMQIKYNLGDEGKILVRELSLNTVMYGDNYTEKFPKTIALSALMVTFGTASLPTFIVCRYDIVQC